ncbi:unnamed protein product, partial [Bubo scandiacus]
YRDCYSRFYQNPSSFLYQLSEIVPGKHSTLSFPKSHALCAQIVDDSFPLPHMFKYITPCFLRGRIQNASNSI